MISMLAALLRNILLLNLQTRPAPAPAPRFGFGSLPFGRDTELPATFFLVYQTMDIMNVQQSAVSLTNRLLRFKAACVQRRGAFSSVGSNAEHEDRLRRNLAYEIQVVPYVLKGDGRECVVEIPFVGVHKVCRLDVCELDRDADAPRRWRSPYPRVWKGISVRAPVCTYAVDVGMCKGTIV